MGKKLINDDDLLKINKSFKIKILSSNRVFTIKHDDFRNPCKLKSQLVA